MIFDDALELIEALKQAGADFMIVGGHALAVHGHVRATLDVDIFLDATPQNAQRIIEALRSWGAPLEAHGVTPKAFSEPGSVYQLGLPPKRIDLLTSIDGVRFEEARSEVVWVELSGKSMPVIGKSALKTNKRAAGRLQDLADLQVLENSSNSDEP